MIYDIEDLLNKDKPQCQAEIDGIWVQARPVNYQFNSFWTRLKTAYKVFTGELDALRWHKQ